MSQQRVAAANQARAEAKAQQMGAVGGIVSAATQMAGSYMDATSKVKAAEAMSKYNEDEEDSPLDEEMVNVFDRQTQQTKLVPKREKDKYQF